MLVVDDEPIQLRSTERVLRRLGYDVECASSAIEARAMIAARSFDLVLSDIAMPGMSGVELLRSLREENPRVPVILMTGEPAIDTAIKALELGAIHYLTKPLDVLSLDEIVARGVRMGRTANS